MGRVPWGYAGGCVQGVYAGGGVSEEVRRGRKEWDFHLKSNDPTLKRWGKIEGNPLKIKGNPLKSKEIH